MADGLQVSDTGRDGSTVYFDIENTSDETLYEFVKLFSGTRYIDLKYLTVHPDETERVTFSDIGSADHRFLLSTNDREDGVIFDNRIEEGSGEDIAPDETEEEPSPAVDEGPETPPIKDEDLDALQEQELTEQRWKELLAEYDDLEGRERKEKQQILERLRKEYEDIGATGEPDDEEEEEGVVAGDTERETGMDTDTTPDTADQEEATGGTGADETDQEEAVDEEGGAVEEMGMGGDATTPDDEDAGALTDIDSGGVPPAEGTGAAGADGGEGTAPSGDAEDEAIEVETFGEDGTSVEGQGGRDAGTTEATRPTEDEDTEDVTGPTDTTTDTVGGGAEDEEARAPEERGPAPEDIETETIGGQEPAEDEGGPTTEATGKEDQESGETAPAPAPGEHPGAEGPDGASEPAGAQPPEPEETDSLPVKVEPEPDQPHPAAVDTGDQQAAQEAEESAQAGPDQEDMDTRHIGGEPAGSHRQDAGAGGQEEQGAPDKESSLPASAQAQEAPAPGPEETPETTPETGAPAPEQVEDDVEERVREMDQQFQERRDAEEAGRGGLAGIVDSIFGRSGGEDADEDADRSGEDQEPSEDTGTDEGAGDEQEAGTGEDGTADDAEEETGPSAEPEKGEDWVPPSERVNRVSTGIIGLDEKMQGGFVEGTMNLVTGKTGVGKTAFCASFLKRGAELNEPGVYVTTEERQEDIRADIEAMFGWRFEELEEAGLVKILSIKPIFPSKEIDNLNRLVRSYISNLLDEVTEAVEDIEADRVIIDSVSIIEMFIRDEYMARVALASLLNNLRESNVTALLTGTVPETSEGLSGGGIIEFLVDTVILLEFVPVAEEHKRTLTIRKMRRTDHEVEIFPFDITPDGIEIYDVM